MRVIIGFFQIWIELWKEYYFILLNSLKIDLIIEIVRALLKYLSFIF